MLAVATAPKRASIHWEQGVVSWGDLIGWAHNPADRKECGDYLLGTLRPTPVLHDKKDTAACTGLHRNKNAIVSRSAITLDVDHAQPGFADTFEMVWGGAAILHTTWKSTPEEPRYRVIIPLDREIAPDEYVVAAETIMTQLGKEFFDPGSSQPERYMFRPSAQSPERYDCRVLDGPPIQVDALLAAFEVDLSKKPIPKAHRNKRNPFELSGVIGAFNRAYEDWDLLIAEYELPYVRISEDRYQLVGARSEAGMGPLAGEPGLVYSHHANDPAAGVTCSAFDLVRLHRFGDLDEEAAPGTPVNRLPSHGAMLELASKDWRVTADIVGMDFGDAATPDDLPQQDRSWQMSLDRKTGSAEVKNTVANRDLICENDPVFQLLRYNELTLSPEAGGDLPWRAVTDQSRIITRTDRWEIANYLERELQGFVVPQATLDNMIETTAARRTVNPVRDYLLGLTWDGVPRLEECLPGVRPTDFTRLVARKVLVAAVARMLNPGCKADYTLVLFGAEGRGKSWWIDRMARGHSAPLGRIDQKDTLLTMQRSWIIVADEGHSLRKADHDAQKEFLTRTHDVYRQPFEKETLVHPRHSVIWSTTNDETFLRRQEGNRRFLVVHCEDKVDFDRLTDEYVDQVWAEALHLYRAGERLFLDDDESDTASEERERFIEEDALGGLIAEWVDTLVPHDWDEKTLEERMKWKAERASGFVAEGTERRDVVCSTQVWVECLDRPIGTHRRSDLLEITAALKRLPGWRKMEGNARVPQYGPQTAFVRIDPEGTDYDLL